MRAAKYFFFFFNTTYILYKSNIIVIYTYLSERVNITTHSCCPQGHSVGITRTHVLRIVTIKIIIYDNKLANYIVGLYYKYSKVTNSIFLFSGSNPARTNKHMVACNIYY